MSFTGAVIILVTAVLRMLLLNRLPKRVFLALWAVAVLRLVIPVTVPSSFSIYSLAQRNEVLREVVTGISDGDVSNVSLAFIGKQEEVGDVLTEETGETIGNYEAVDDGQYNGILNDKDDRNGNSKNIIEDEKVINDKNDKTEYEEGYSLNSKLKDKLIFTPRVLLYMIYIAGVVILALFFVNSYRKCYREFHTSMPVSHKMAESLMAVRHLRRKISLRQAGFIDAPLTYGIISPVILLPDSMDWEDKEKLQYILAHELVHIKRFDGVTKIVLTAVLCIHWFNPAVCLMYNLLNRDLELSCDERVVHEFGEKARAPYARTLIYMEEKKSGLVPLYNNFSRNMAGGDAMEERITSIMKMKKTSGMAAFAGIALILVMAVVFTTSAAAGTGRKDLKRLPFEDISDEESEKLLALWFEGYETMTVADFQEKAWELTDTEAYMDLIEDFSKAGYAIETEEGKEADAFNRFMDYFYNVFEPLTAEKWQTRDFSGVVMTELEPKTRGQVSWEYVMSLTILEPESLTVGEYREARLSAIEDMRDFLQGRTEEELADDVYLQEAARDVVEDIEEKRSSKKLKLSIEYILFPLEDGLNEAVNAESKELWDETLAPYVEFGLTYEYNPVPGNLGNGLKMYWHGLEVRGICDEEKGMWITEHAGNSNWSEDAIELYVVYEKGKIVGLRQASGEEQDEWDTIRNQNSSALEEEIREKRSFPYGTREDYDSLSELMKTGYKEKSVADFNEDVLVWCNEDYDRMERVGTDGARDDYEVTLTKEQKDFAAYTLWFSRMENYRRIESEQTGKKEKDPDYSGRRLNRQSENRLAWCMVDYQFTYHITDKERLTVGERDECLMGMMTDIHRFWEETGLESLLLMEEDDIVEQFQFFAKKNSNDLLTIRIDGSMVHYQYNDERGYA